MMAEFLPQTPITRSDPKFSKSLTGDFTFDLECARSRGPSFLARNVRRVLSYHKGRLYTDSASLAKNNDPSRTHARHHPQAKQIRHDSSEDQSAPIALPIRTMETLECVSRRSARNLQQVMYNNDLAELSINLCNIRKLLDFKSNRPAEDERPAKRVKKDHTRGQCSLTIWDDRAHLGSPEPIVTKNEACSLTSVDNGTYGPCVFIDLDKPFNIKAKELKVSTYHDGEIRPDIADHYFMEFKIIPTRQDVDWPPIPILGKSDADHYTGPGKLPSQALAGALVMKYTELPTAPGTNMPLRAFFLFEGLTFRTKYGLEVSAVWKTPESEKNSKDSAEAQCNIRASSQIDTATTQSNVREKPRPDDRAQIPTPNSEDFPAEAVKRRRRKIKVTYHFEPNTCRSQEVLKQYRTAEVIGLVCPACPNYKADDLEELRHHFLLSHHKYNFVLGEVVEHEAGGEPREIVFEVTPVPLPKPSSRLIRTEQEFEWKAKATPFDLRAFLDGDTSWLGVIGEPSKQSLRKAPPIPVSDVNLLADPVSEYRSQDSGFLAAENVRKFRTSSRKKYPVIRLVRQIDDKRATYNSINHRQTYSSEEPMSETDDEVEDEWFIQRHIENLDIAAREESWDAMKGELFRRWDRHRLVEKLEHSRFLSDSLIRFVQKEKKWLATEDDSLQEAFRQLLAELTRSRFIDAQVSTEVTNIVSQANVELVEPGPSTADMAAQPSEISLSAPMRKKIRLVFHILQNESHLDSDKGLTQQQLAYFDGDDLTPVQLNRYLRIWNSIQSRKFHTSGGPPSANKPLPVIQTPTPMEEIKAWRTTILSNPAGHCGICVQPVLNRVTQGIHCHSPECPTVSVWYHLKCVKLKKRRDWTCRGCKAEEKLVKNRAVDDQVRIDRKGKGKERAN